MRKILVPTAFWKTVGVGRKFTCWYRGLRQQWPGQGHDRIEFFGTSEIKEALSEDYGVATINSVEDQIKMIPNPYAFYILQDDESGSGNVFSWNIIDILNNAE